MSMVPATVARLLSRCAVIAQAVCFHDEPEVGPEEVDTEAAHDLARFGHRKSCKAHEGEKPALEL